MFYTHGSLDRSDHLRRDDAALQALENAPTSRVIPVWRGTLLVNVPAAGGGEVRLASVAGDVALPSADTIFLGMLDHVAWFASSVSSLDDDARLALAQQATDPDGSSVQAEFADLRVVGPRLSSEEGSLLAYARGLVYWQEHARFCEQCGRALSSSNGGHIRTCDNPEGAHSAFPRTDPAVIMLVIDPPVDGHPARCLLGRSPAWPSGVFSTLAGFIEPGESLEQGVQREVFEESGITTRDVRYIASQPWPFPRSIMLGFEAVATSRDIVIDPLELADARWFTREELRDFGSWGDERFALQLPRSDSIARFLIDRWLSEEHSDTST